jgi:hypothetical protein
MYYRGCWHIVSRGFLIRYRQSKIISYPTISSLITELYNPKTVITHAALLHQTFVHCEKFPTAASRRSLGRISVPMWPINLSVRLTYHRLGEPLPHLLANTPHPHLLAAQTGLLTTSDAIMLSYAVLAVVSNCCPPLKGRLDTCYSPVRHWVQAPRSTLHVLGMPPAFILSQDQTLVKI